MQDGKSCSMLLMMNAYSKNKRKHRSAHSRDRQTFISYLQINQGKEKAKLGGCATLQDIARPPSSSPGTTGLPQVGFAQALKSFAIWAAPEVDNILAKAERCDELKRALATEWRTNAYLVSSENHWKLECGRLKKELSLEPVDI